MTKELIISTNVYEKKVALIEEGVVTEFYVERRDENQGVVGNLYKGRVMKVLPGMQSAFVDIGLERDAFLYVTDFTEFIDDDDDVDFKEVADQGQRPAPEERGRRDRREREAAPPRPARREEEKAGPVEEVVADVIEQLAEIATESRLPQPQPDDELDAAATAGAPPAESGGPEDRAERAAYRWAAQRDTTPGPVFERIADDDFSPVIDEANIPLVTEESVNETVPVEAETAAEGTSSADAKPRRSSRSKKKIIEPEPAAKTARRGKKPVAEAGAAPAEETAEAGKKSGRATKSAPAKRPSRKGKAEADESAAATSFERIDDEFAGGIQEDRKPAKPHSEGKKAAAEEKPAFQPEPEPEWRIGSFRAQAGGGSGFQRIADESSEERGGEKGSSPARSASAETDVVGEPDSADERQQASADPSSGSEAAVMDEDRGASVRDLSHREEFAVRRGGRGRRRPPRRDGKGPVGPAGGAAEGEAEEEPAPAKAEGAPEKTESRPADHRRPEPQHSRRERGGPPTISDLLREGQEVLVQIAKEPIAKKGARITSHIALPGRFLVYMPTVNHIGVSRKIPSDAERVRLKRLVVSFREKEGAPGGFIARTACAGTSDQELQDDMRYLIRTWNEIRKKADRAKPPSLVHRDLDLIQRILRDQLADDFSVIRVDNEIEYARIVEFVNRVQPRLVNRVKLYTGSQPILEKYNVQPEIDKAVKPRVWLKSGGYIVINQTEALVAIDVNTGKFVGKSDKLEDTITRTNLEAAKELVRQIRLRDLGGIIIVDFIDMEERKNRIRVTQVLQEALAQDRSPSKILSINDFGLLAITRKRVKQSLERTLCTPCPYCQGSGLVKSSQTMCFEILEQAKAIAPQVAGSSDVLLRVSPVVAESLHTTERQVFEEIEAYFGTPVTIEADYNLHQEQYDFAIA